jgi:hypothetical protein
MAENQASSYPLAFSVDYPEQRRNRLTTFFRILVAIPILVILMALTGGSFQAGTEGARSFGGLGFIFIPVLLMILFRHKYPRWWYDWNLQFVRFTSRVSAFILLLRDEYPSTDEEQAVHVDFPYPDATLLNRWLPLVKWLLAMPHWVILAFLGIIACLAVFIAWFAILLTGRYPRGLFDFVVGVMRWSLRVEVYALLLITDQYPPFSLK